MYINTYMMKTTLFILSLLGFGATLYSIIVKLMHPLIGFNDVIYTVMLAILACICIVGLIAYYPELLLKRKVSHF